MRIVMTSERLPPKAGGLSTVAAILTAGLIERGHELAIVTTDPESATVLQSTRVVKLSSIRNWWRYFQLLRTADVVLQNNISTKTLVLPLLMRKPTVVALHIWLETPEGVVTWREKLKIALLQRCSRIVTPNMQIVERFGGEGEFATNGYDESIFNRRREWGSRESAFVVVARLIKEKGVYELLEAFSIVAEKRTDYFLNIVGTGPEEERLRRLVFEHNLQDKVRFLGVLTPSGVSDIMNNSKVMCVPSLGEEVFGIVALEGMGCGLPVIATDVSGLADAQHGFGILVTPDEHVVEHLAQAMIDLTLQPDTPLEYLGGVEDYLNTRDRAAMVDAYESVMSKLG